MEDRISQPLPRWLPVLTGNWVVLTLRASNEPIAVNPASIRTFYTANDGWTIIDIGRDEAFHVREDWRTVAARLQGQIDPAAVRQPERPTQDEEAKRARSLFGGIEPIAPLGYQRMADAPKDQRIIGVDDKGVEKLMCWWRATCGWMAITSAGTQLGVFQPIGWKEGAEWGGGL